MSKAALSVIRARPARSNVVTLTTYHSISEQHLQKYVDEFAFRWNTRKSLGIEDFERAAAILQGRRGEEADLSTV